MPGENGLTDAFALPNGLNVRPRQRLDLSQTQGVDVAHRLLVERPDVMQRSRRAVQSGELPAAAERLRRDTSLSPRYIIASSPRFLTIERSFRDGPLGFFWPRSHSLTSFGCTFKYRANTPWLTPA
jgi:hypothetical protein